MVSSFLQCQVATPVRNMFTDPILFLALIREGSPLVREDFI